MIYTIDVRRTNSIGTLSFRSGSVNVSTTCWWDPKVKVDAGTYTGYATRMSTKTDSVTKQKRPAIWLGPKVPVNGGARTARDIFIHEGTGPSWSDGCIVVKRDEMIRIWDAISPQDQPVVTIRITG